MKKKLFVILVAILTVIPFTLIMPKASSTILKYDTVTSSYGSYSYTITKSTDQIEFGFEQWGFSIPFPEGSTLTFEYNFNKAYSGRFDLLITNSTSWVWNTCYVMVDGGYFETPLPTKNTATTGKTFKIHVNNTDHIVITFVSTASTLFNANTSISVSANYLTDGVELSDIDATLDMYIPGMSTTLSNIYSGIGYDGNTSTSLNADTLAYDISLIKTYIDGIEGYISGTNTYIDQVETYLNQLININRIQARPLYQQSALLWALTYGDLNYDNLFPSFVYNTSNNNSAYTAVNRLCVAPKSTYSLYIYTINQLGASSWNIYMRGTDTPITSTRTYAFTPPSTQYYLYRFDFINNSSSHVYFEIEFLVNVTIMPLFYGNKNNVPDDIHYLFGDELNNTYTRLLQEISNGVNGVYDTSEYEQYDQVIDNLNDSLLIDVDNSKNSILTDISNQSGIGSGLNLNNVRTAVNGFYNDLTTIFPSIKYLVIFGMIILVLGVMF